MHRIDHPTAAATPPAIEPAGDPGYFTEGNPSGATLATVVTADWANALQEEIANVIEGRGITLDKTQNNQLLEAIIDIVASAGTDPLLRENNLDDLTNVPAARDALGLGTAAVANTGLSSANVPTVAQGDSRWAKLDSPTFAGVPKAPTASAGTNTTQLATTAFVQAAIAAALQAYLPKNNPTFTGTMTGPAYNET